MARRELAAVRTPAFNVVGISARTRHAAESLAILEKIKALPLEEAADALVDVVIEELARVLRLSPKEVDRHRPLADIGMDSLMMLELRNTVESSLGIELPMMSLSSGITPTDVARRIAPLVIGAQEQNVPGSIVALSTSHFAAEAEAAEPEEQQAAVAAVLGKMRELEGPP
jgi:acyl carrier protein